MTLLAPLLALVLTGLDDAPVVAPTSPPTIARPRHSESPEATVIWNLTLAEAFRLGLTNSEAVRVVATGTQGVPPAGFTPLSVPNPNAPIGRNDLTAANVPLPGPGRNAVDLVVARASADTSVWPFKAALMAHLRSVEQTYWALAAQEVAVASRETAVRLGEEILKGEKNELEISRGGSNTADVAEAEQQLENFKLNLVTATSDWVATERQLRTILGLPLNDNRRIVASTAATEAEVDPSWETTLDQMLASQPEVVAQRELLATAALKEALILDNSPPTDSFRTKARQERERQQSYLREITHQTTHTLARFFLEVDANFKQFRTARRLKDAADKRLAAQQAFYQEGRITVDRLLDALSQSANANAQEAQHLMSYNTTLAAFEEARGTLLEVDGVTIALPARPGSAPIASVVKTPEPTGFKLRAAVGGVNLLDVEVSRTSSATPK